MAFLLRMRKDSTLFLFILVIAQIKGLLRDFDLCHNHQQGDCYAGMPFFLYVPFSQQNSGFSKNKAAGKTTPLTYIHIHILRPVKQPELPVSGHELNPPPFHSSVWSEELFPSVCGKFLSCHHTGLRHGWAKLF